MSNSRYEEFVTGHTTNTPGIIKGDGFLSVKTFYGDPTEYDKGCVYKGDGFVAVKKYVDGPINPKSHDKYVGDGFVAVKQGQRKPTADKSDKVVKNIKVIFPDGKKIKINLPKGKYKLIDLKKQLNLDNATILLRNDSGDLVELLNTSTLFSWDKIHVKFSSN
uniref:Uncharacterized protein n=1 Tax=Strigamia maritima TaxID=126957 RepID=T1IWY6_STRMM